jgi:hypothetical protein
MILLLAQLLSGEASSSCTKSPRCFASLSQVRNLWVKLRPSGRGGCQIARLEVNRALARSGGRREEIALPGSITKGAGCVASSSNTRRRLEPSIGTSSGAVCAEMAPRWTSASIAALCLTRLILTQKGGPFELSVKRRVKFDGGAVEYLAAESLRTYVSRPYHAAGLGAGYSSHSGEHLPAALPPRGTRLKTLRSSLGIRISITLLHVWMFRNKNYMKPSPHLTSPRKCVLHNFVQVRRLDRQTRAQIRLICCGVDRANEQNVLR